MVSLAISCGCWIFVQLLQLFRCKLWFSCWYLNLDQWVDIANNDFENLYQSWSYFKQMKQKTRCARMLMNFHCIQSNAYQAYFLDIYFWTEFKWSLKNNIQIRSNLFLVCTLILQEIRYNKTLLQSYMSRTPRIRPIECYKIIFPITGHEFRFFL